VTPDGSAGRAARIGAPLLAALLACGLVVGLTWPLAQAPGAAIPEGFFHGGHVWVLDHVAAMLAGQRPLVTDSAMLGVPSPVELRPVALVPALLAAPLRPLLGAVAAYDVVLVLSFGLAALAAHALLRGLGASPWTSAAGGLAYAACPFALGALGSGQLAKIQHWTLPLLLLTWVLAARGRWLGVALVLPAAAALAFTSPTMALWAPFAGAPLLLHAAWGRWSDGWPARLHAFGGAALALGLTAGVLLLARDFYSPDLPQVDQAFVPAVRLAGGRVDELTPVATLSNLLWRPPDPGRVDWRTVSHVASLGVPMLLVGLPLGLWRARARWAGLAVTLAGASLALGPRLLLADGPALVGGYELSLPAALLDAVDYPTATSGMYYRAAVVGSLGLSLLLAGGATRVRFGAVVAWAVALAQVAFAVWATGFLWPRPVLPVPGAALAAEASADPVPGAVLHLPARVDDGGGSLHLLTAAVHGRPTTALPRNTARMARTDANLAVLAEATTMGGAAGRAHLAAAGFRYVTWLDGIRVPDGDADRAAVEALLGEPRREGRLSMWVVE
jgi:hypothetical protein